MLVTRTPSRRQVQAAQAAKGIDIGQVGLGARQQLIGRLPATSRAREAVAQPRSRLHSKRMKRWREVGSSQKDAGKAKDHTKEALGVRVLLRSVYARERLLHMLGRQELAKVVRDESWALIRAHNLGLEGVRQALFSTQVGDETFEASLGDTGRHMMAGPHAAIAGARIHSATEGDVAVDNGRDKRPSKVHVDPCPRSRLRLWNRCRPK